METVPEEDQPRCSVSHCRKGPVCKILALFTISYFWVATYKFRGAALDVAILAVELINFKITGEWIYFGSSIKKAKITVM